MTNLVTLPHHLANYKSAADCYSLHKQTVHLVIILNAVSLPQSDLTITIQSKLT
jgi:hypothetical protein